ncbi:MAG: HD domain-containing protein [Pirellulaceae bacterium]
MPKKICPGQDTRFWTPADVFDIACGTCGTLVEFFKDETHRRCRNCGERVTNPRISLGCAQWCGYAKQCLGYDPKETGQEPVGEESLLDRLTTAMKKEFGPDQARINHAITVLSYARRILAGEPANAQVVFAAAVLHDIGIVRAEKKHGSSIAKYQEEEGPPIAEHIMQELGFDQDTIEHVSRIVANHHSARDIDTPEFRIIWDADHIVNLGEKGVAPERLRQLVERVFKTQTGAQIAIRELAPA